jgi:hypothetical protein
MIIKPFTMTFFNAVYIDLICVLLVKMSVEDVTKLVSSNRKFDLLVVGLQEAPKSDVSQVLQEALAETHV